MRISDWSSDVCSSDLVRIGERAEGARNHTQCDSLLIGDRCGAHTFPYTEIRNPSAIVEHEATTSKISEDQLFYCRSRGIGEEDAVSMIVNGFCKDVFKELPMERSEEHTSELQSLMRISYAVFCLKKNKKTR